jgi:hypothetical protein
MEWILYASLFRRTIQSPSRPPKGWIFGPRPFCGSQRTTHKNRIVKGTTKKWNQVLQRDTNRCMKHYAPNVLVEAVLFKIKKKLGMTFVKLE